jgi:adenosylmethionine-8-amino-7-oxononanoate aminotransferase
MDRGRKFFHSSSYTANPIACAAANANLAIWRDEPVEKRIATLAQRHAVRLDAIASHPLVRNPRRTGTIAAFDVGTAEGYLSDLAPRLLALFRNRNILLQPLGNTIYLMPPYCIQEAQLDSIYTAIGDVLETLGDGS